MIIRLDDPNMSASSTGWEHQVEPPVTVARADEAMLERLARWVDGPCVTLCVPTHRSGAAVRQDPVRVKHLLRDAHAVLAEAMGPVAAERMLHPLRQFTELDAFRRGRTDGLVLYASPLAAYGCRLPYPVDELVVVDDRYHLTPLLPSLSGEGLYFVLALGQKLLRLFGGTRESWWEVDLGDIPRTIDEALGFDWTDPSFQFHTGAPGGGGRRNAMFHGQGQGGETRKAELRKFLRIVDDHIAAVLRHDRFAPLVVTAVEYVAAMFGDVSRHAHLVSGAEIGNPASLTPADLHRRTWALVAPVFGERQRQAAERFHRFMGSGRTAVDLPGLLAAACDGRVEVLWVATDAHRWGSYDRQTGDLDDRAERRSPTDACLLNRMAVDAVAHGAVAYGVKAAELPGGELAAGILRY